MKNNNGSLMINLNIDDNEIKSIHICNTTDTDTIKGDIEAATKSVYTKETSSTVFSLSNSIYNAFFYNERISTSNIKSIKFIKDLLERKYILYNINEYEATIFDPSDVIIIDHSAPKLIHFSPSNCEYGIYFSLDELKDIISYIKKSDTENGKRLDLMLWGITGEIGGID